MNDLILSIIGSDAFQAALIAGVVAAATAAARYGVGVAKLLKQRLTHDLDAKQLALLRDIAQRVVLYAEQAYKDQDGAAKLAAAIAAADPFLKAYGLKVTAEQLRAVIEAAVLVELAHSDMPAPPPEG